jgi:excisionase family DNA binding protein
MEEINNKQIIPSWLTLSEVAKILVVGKSTIRTWLQEKKIPQNYFRKTEEGVYLFKRSFIEYKKNQQENSKK